ncbi:26198_t:CDS:2, partial [Gigaspora margarita]
GNEVIDKWLIQVNKSINIAFLGCFEFIPYKQFSNGFSKIYKATCIDGIKREWNSRKQNFRYDKILENYLEYIKSHYPFPNYKVSNYLGITQDPQTKNFMIVIEYAENGDLHKFISKKFYTLSWYEKLRILQDIAYGIERIHSKQIIHQDLHPGNILVYNNSERSYTKISDFGINILKKIRTKELDITEVTKISSVEGEPSPVKNINSKSIYASGLLTSTVYEAIRQYNETKCVIDWGIKPM